MENGKASKLLDRSPSRDSSRFKKAMVIISISRRRHLQMPTILPMGNGNLRSLARQNLPLGKSWLTIFTLMTVILLLTNLERFSEALKRTRLRVQMILPPTCWNCLTILIYNLFCFYPMIVGTDRRSQMTWKWLECTRVTSIFKKGNPELLSNYRPIFLLSVFCKLFASLVLSTFRPKIGPYIWKTQLGFEKPTAHKPFFGQGECRIKMKWVAPTWISRC